jgi:hypothetical protein
LAFEIVGSQLDRSKPLPRYKKVLSFSKVKSIEHMANTCIFIKEHIFLHSVIFGGKELILHDIDSPHESVLQKVL